MSLFPDPQAELVYKAEWATSYYERSFKYRDTLDMTLRLNEIRNSRAYKRALGYNDPIDLYISDERISLAGVFNYNIFGGEPKIILFSSYECNDATFLHEFCHYLSIRKYGTMVPSHGWQFARLELGIIRCFVSKADYEDLLYHFDIRKVKH